MNDWMILHLQTQQTELSQNPVHPKHFSFYPVHPKHFSFYPVHHKHYSFYPVHLKNFSFYSVHPKHFSFIQSTLNISVFIQSTLNISVFIQFTLNSFDRFNVFLVKNLKTSYEFQLFFKILSAKQYLKKMYRVENRFFTSWTPSGIQNTAYLELQVEYRTWNILNFKLNAEHRIH